jgi:hypothetical protein
MSDRIAELLEWAKTNPNDWHQRLNAERLAQPEPAAAATSSIDQLPKTFRTESAIAAIAAICQQCDFKTGDFETNGGRCQHLGCQYCPGLQANAGGLRALIRFDNYFCPAGKWK